jgi:hypothetical protein
LFHTWDYNDPALAAIDPIIRDFFIFGKTRKIVSVDFAQDVSFLASLMVRKNPLMT